MRLKIAVSVVRFRPRAPLQRSKNSKITSDLFTLAFLQPILAVFGLFLGKGQPLLELAQGWMAAQAVDVSPFAEGLDGLDRGNRIIRRHWLRYPFWELATLGGGHLGSWPPWELATLGVDRVSQSHTAAAARAPSDGCAVRAHVIEISPDGNRQARGERRCQWQLPRAGGFLDLDQRGDFRADEGLKSRHFLRQV